MDIVRNSAPRAGRIFAALGVLTASVLSAVVPTLVSADTVTERSIALSSSTKSNPNTSYDVSFTSKAASTQVVEIDFCDTAIIEGACSAPDINTSLVETTAGTATPTNSNKGVKVVLTAPVTPAGTVAFTLTKITNPSTAQTMYARIVTYADDTAYVAGYKSVTDLDNAGADPYLDSGAVALTITDGFSVSGSVAESLAFCASGANTIATGCTSGVTAPNLKLAGASGALELAPSEGTIYSQISTNAVSGAAVWLKSSTPGGGLARAGEADSDIKPLTTATTGGTFPTGTAKFGLKLAGLSGATAEGTYSASEYYLGSAVTSTYGDKIFSVAGPVSDSTANMTFAATMSNVTPAGSYSATLNLIATGKF